MLTKEEVIKISNLCRIDLTSAEVEKFQRELSQVLEYASELSQVNTDGVEEISQVTGLENVFRHDVAVQSDIRDELVALFPDSRDGFLKIKSIL
jgi:aspartyl-tRNA(Asn)/glutamyl-tRNA(Gln) amidotransferase subunit C